MVREINYRPLIDNFLQRSIHLRESKEQTRHPQFLFLFRHRVGLVISDAVFKRRNQINSTFIVLERVFKVKSSCAGTKFLKSMATQENTKHWPQHHRDTFVQANVFSSTRTVQLSNHDQ